MRWLRAVRARLIVNLPPQSLVLHASNCWSSSQWDSLPSKFASQLWKIPCPVTSNDVGPFPVQLIEPTVSLQQDDWKKRRYDFHTIYEYSPLALSAYRDGQQDARQYKHDGFIAATDGSVQLQAERMGAGYIVVDRDGNLLWELSASVGGPLASLRAEAASLLSLLRTLKDDILSTRIKLLIFIDCLVLLEILLKWGKRDFWPHPRDILHFDILLPLLQELRNWPAHVILMKVKSHAGCQLNDMADERADAGCISDVEPLFPGPHKYGSLHLRIKPALRSQLSEDGVNLPRDSAPNKTLLQRLVARSMLQAARQRGTIFVNDILRQPASKYALQVVNGCSESAIRCWIKMTTGTYPVATYLHRIRPDISPICCHCDQGARETLTHFLKCCPKFRSARTLMHNRVCQVLQGHLEKHLSREWKLYAETPIGRVGLSLLPVSTEIVQQAEREISTLEPSCQLGRWQPDFIVISHTRKLIAIGPEISLPSDSHINQLSEAYNRKKRRYTPLLTALQQYVDNGWTIRILPWIVGARGLICEQHLTTVLDYLDIPQSRWSLIISCTVQESIETLAYMHKIRYSLQNKNKISITMNPGSRSILQDQLQRRGNKRKRLNQTDDSQALLKKWKSIQRKST